MCSLAVFAFLRVGKITKTRASTPPPFQIHQLTKLLNPAREVVGIKLAFQDIKHNYNQRPFSLVVNRHYLIILNYEAML